MPQISQRALNLPQSAVRKLVPLADAAKKAGVKVYHLNIGQPDVDSPANLTKIVQSFNEKHIAYTHFAGKESYRQKLVEYYKRYEIEINTNEILVTTSGSEALFFAFSICLNPGEEILTTEPFYSNYSSIAQMAGVSIRGVESDIANNFALPDIAKLEATITPKTKAFLLCNPNNPTGYTYSKAEIEKLYKLAEKHDLYLIADEVYREFCYLDEKPVSILNIAADPNRIVMLDSISKRYNVCGLRIGALVSRNPEIMSAAIKFGQARLSPPALGEYVAENLADTEDAYFEAVSAEYKKRRDLLVSGLNTIPGVKCSKPDGAFYCIAELPVTDTDDFCAWLLTDFRKDNSTVMLAPGTGFYSNPESGKNKVRIAYVLNTEDLAKAVDCLRVALKEYSKVT